MPETRSIRDMLDAFSGENDSFTVRIATNMINAVFDYYFNNVYLSGTVSSRISSAGNSAIYIMRDSHGGSGNSTPSNFTGQAPNGGLPVGHGINVIDQETQPSPGSNITPNGFGQISLFGGSINKGMRHYAHQVQFGKGISVGYAPGLPNQTNVGFMTGGTNLSPVAETNNTYRSINIKMSEFKTVEKLDPVATGYIHNDTPPTDQYIPIEGSISIGTAADDFLFGPI